MLDLNRAEARIRRYEKILAEFYQEDVVDVANRSLLEAISAYSAWHEGLSTRIDEERAILDRTLKALKSLETRIDDINQQIHSKNLDTSDRGAIARHNDLVNTCNKLVAQHKDMADDYNRQETSYNKQVGEFNQEQSRRQSELEITERDIRQRVERYRQWVVQERPQQYWKEVNVLYASLIQSARDERNHALAQSCVERIRRIRQQLGDHVIQRHSGMGGCHVVQSILCDGEECKLTVDCGASVTSITPEMVDILGLRHLLGDEVDIVLPHAIHVKARQLTIPKMTVHQMSADFVKAVVLKASTPGIDGCLGINFLDKFDYSISRDGLQLEPTQKLLESSRYDVFISHKSADYALAQEVFDLLTRKGYRVFLSEVSLPRGRRTDFLRAIDTTIENSKHFVIVGSSVENLTSPWVYAELQLFELLKREGKKAGNVVPIISGPKKDIVGLPVTLRQYAVLFTDASNWKTELLDYLPRHED